MIHSPALMELTNAAEEPEPLDWEMTIRRAPPFRFNYNTIRSLNDTEEGFGESDVRRRIKRAVERENKKRN